MVNPREYSFEKLLDAPLRSLMEQSRAIRDKSFGKRITYSPKVFIPLTMLCRDRCGYCTFAKAPARIASAYLDLDEVRGIAQAGKDQGCHEALFTLGENPEARYPEARSWLTDHGYKSTVDYLSFACGVVRDEMGLLPHANAGALSLEELVLLRPVSASQGMMIETLVENLGAHKSAPDKTPARRLETLKAAGKAQIPFTTGILVGIGETRSDRIDALRAIAEIHARFGHVQEVIVQNFLPKPGTAMHRHPPCPSKELLWSIAVARIILPPDIHLQAPPNLSEDFGSLLDAGIDDWGGVSPVTSDHVNPERAWPALEKLREVTEAHGFSLAPRLTIYPEFALEPKQWLDPEMAPYVLAVSDADGLGRDHLWCSGGSLAPPQLLTKPTKIANSRTALIDPRIREVLDGVALGHEVGEEELVCLFSARGHDVNQVCEIADDLRRQINGDDVTFVANRNINYTNVCTFKCKFCAFSKGPLSLNLRGAPYLLDLEEITHRVAEAETLGATEVCLQGGIHPKFDGEYYLDVLRAVRKASQTIHIHAFTALEVTEGARRSGISLEAYLRQLQDAGLKTLPGTAAEILDDEVRAVLCPDKVNTEEWLEAHRVAHLVGLRSNVTIMFGAIESARSWARHIMVTRNLQKETGGFTEFVPLPFVHMAAPMFLQGKSRKGPTFRETLLMHAVGRIAYRELIPNIQVSWVKTGIFGARQCLMAGVNDLGGTLMDENISRAAGASHGQKMGKGELEELVKPLTRPLIQRTTLYGRVESALVAAGASS